ncbi:MAG TPA: alpha/beta fold hydrolase [Candidatus Limnocylindrales bacterium]|nr:alpha/beta fold hydrolase [Candidatus Limnocylindrales bacterium]
MNAGLPAAISATLADLPPAAAERLATALREPDPGVRQTTSAAGIPFASLAWGEPSDRPLVLIHGITASARLWWRVGPALAATGRRVVAVDQPGHGSTGHWAGRHRFRETAADIAAWTRAAGLDVPELQVVGHSWGAMTAAALPVARIRPATLVLLDPPAVSHAVISQLVNDPSEQVYPDIATASAVLTAANPAWSAEDVQAKAEGLVQLDAAAALSVLLENGDWDGGLADISDPAADGVPVWVIRGDPATGSLLPDPAIPGFAARIGADHSLTLAGAPHSPQRTHPEATTLALLRALG